MLDNTVTLVGNLVDDPRSYTTQSGLARANFRIAAAERRFDRESSRWVDGTPLFLEVVSWRRIAEHVQASLHKGDRVIVVGRLRRREYTNQAGEQRSVTEIEADAVGPDLQYAPAAVQRQRRAVPPAQAETAA